VHGALGDERRRGGGGGRGLLRHEAVEHAQIGRALFLLRDLVCLLGVVHVVRVVHLVRVLGVVGVIVGDRRPAVLG